MTSPESEIRDLLSSWADAVEAADLDRVVAAHSPDVVMFDVPPPVQNVGIDSYRDSWPQFFSYLDGGEFRWQELHVVADQTVGFGYGLIGCKATGRPLFPVRVTICLRREAAQWVIINEHHSVPST